MQAWIFRRNNSTCTPRLPPSMLMDLDFQPLLGVGARPACAIHTGRWSRPAREMPILNGVRSSARAIGRDDGTAAARIDQRLKTCMTFSLVVIART